MMDPDNSGSDRSVADVLVLGGIVVTMDQRRSILSDGALAICGDSIAALGPRPEIVDAYRATTTLDATGCLVIPANRRPHAHPDDALPRPRRRPAAAHVARTARVASGTSVHQSRDRPVGEPSRGCRAVAFGSDYAMRHVFL